MLSPLSLAPNTAPRRDGAGDRSTSRSRFAPGAPPHTELQPPRGAARGLILLGVALALGVGWARPALGADPPQPGADSKKKDGAKDEDELRVELRGRVVTRATLEQHETTVVSSAGTLEEDRITSLDLGVRQARLGAKVRLPGDVFSAEVEGEFAGRPRLKDAYAQARGRIFTARAGQFRMPGIAIEMESSWNLPVVDRGLLSLVLEDRLEIGGRRPGLQLAVRGHGDPRLRLTLGAFQGSRLDDAFTRETGLLAEAGVRSQNLVARAEVESGPLELGGFFVDRVGTPEMVAAGEEPPHYLAGGLDAVFAHETARGGVRLWVDGVLGESWYEHLLKAPDDRDAVFATVRVLGAWRAGGAHRGDFYVEPFVRFGLLDPDLDVEADAAWEEAAGVHVGAWDRARVGLEVSSSEALRNFPTAYTVQPWLGRQSALLQAGLVF